MSDTREPDLEGFEGDPALVIAGHQFACKCTGCRRKRGTYKSPRQEAGEKSYSKRQPLRLTEEQKEFVERKGGNEFLRGLIDRERFEDILS